MYYGDSKPPRKPKNTPKTSSTKSYSTTRVEDVQGEVIDYINASPENKILVHIDDLTLNKEELSCLTSPAIDTCTERWLHTPVSA